MTAVLVFAIQKIQPEKKTIPLFSENLLIDNTMTQPMLKQK